MNLIMITAAFCGGFFGAAIGSIPSFIMTGFIALSAGILTLAGIGEQTISSVAFGPFFGPHISFAAAAAAASFAANKRNTLDSSMEILTPLLSKNDPLTLIVGGIYGIIGYVVFYLMSLQNILITDNPAFAVTFVLILNRYVFGKDGLFGREINGNKRYENLKSNEVINMGLFGMVLGVVVALTAIILRQAGVKESAMGIYPVFVFGISAFSLIFLQAGWSMPITHHISYPAAATYILSNSVIITAVVAALNAILWAWFCKYLNENRDTYIDPPACVITLSLAIVNFIF